MYEIEVSPNLDEVIDTLAHRFGVTREEYILGAMCTQVFINMIQLSKSDPVAHDLLVGTSCINMKKVIEYAQRFKEVP